MLLLIDAGNTRTKWALVNEHGEIIQHDACNNHQLSHSDFSTIQTRCQRVIISNVAGPSHAEYLSKLLGSKLPLEWFSASKNAGDLTNHYHNVASLGSDRWAALIAAWHIARTTTIVVNAGTAITVDALIQNASDPTQGDFVGGMILPGLTLMQTSLGLATAQLPHEINVCRETNSVFGKTTDDAIVAGTLSAAVGAIQQMIYGIQQGYTIVPKIIISGGDAYRIATSLTDSVTTDISIVDNLVIKGLYLSSLNS